MKHSVPPFAPGSFDMVMSFTRTHHFRGCPWDGAMTYKHIITGNEADRQFSGSSDARDRGRDVHDVIARYRNHCLTNRLTHDEAAGERFLAEVITENPRPEHVTQEVRDICHNYLASTRFDLLEPGAVFGVEQELWAILTDPKSGLRVAYNGRIDHFRVNGEHCFVLDEKSTRQIMKSSAFRAEHQLPSYVDLLMQQPQFDKVKRGIGVINYPAIEGGHSQEKAVTLEMVMDFRAWLFETARMIQRGIARVRAGEPIEVAFEPRPGKACSPFADVACDWVDRCPHYRKPNRRTISTREEAIEALGDYLQGKVANDNLFDLLKMFANVNGAIEKNGKVLMPEIDDSAKVLDAAALVTYLYEQGRLDDLQVKSRSLVSLGVATDLAKNLVEQGLVAITQEPEIRIRNVEES